MITTNLIKTIGSGFYSGFIPFAPGTMGSLVALLIYLIPGFENPYVILPSIILSIMIGIPISTKFEEMYGKDPKQCVIDEVSGTWISLLFLPKTFWVIASAFVIWRIFDIFKPYPANKLELLRAGWGIMLDDVMSGIYTFIIMHIVIYFIF